MKAIYKFVIQKSVKNNNYVNLSIMNDTGKEGSLVFLGLNNFMFESNRATLYHQYRNVGPF